MSTGTDPAADRTLVTGGAGFIGASIAIALKQRFPVMEVTALDNLHRRGSDLNIARLEQEGVRFVRGDVRVFDDLASLDRHDAIVECSAEPSVLAGLDDARYMLDTNLAGAYNCLELARRDSAQMIFLSTSRIYPLAHLAAIDLDETDTRFEISAEQQLPGVGPSGISESFPLDGARTLYGTTKFAAELLVEEYRESFGITAAVNRCGVIAGPWQMGKVDQGVFTHWVLSHYFKRPLSYIGFGGQGKQVRDLLHVDDLIELVSAQIADPAGWDGALFNVAGGRTGSLSLLETTLLCRELTGNHLEIRAEPSERPGDVPVFIGDCAALQAARGWRPSLSPEAILADIFEWVRANERPLSSVLD